MKTLFLILFIFISADVAFGAPANHKSFAKPTPAQNRGVELYTCKSENYPLDRLKLKLIDATLLQIRYTGAKEDQYFALQLPQPKGSLHFPALYLGYGNTLRQGFQNKKKFLDKVYFSTEEEGTEIVFTHANRRIHYLCESTP